MIGMKASIAAFFHVIDPFSLVGVVVRKGLRAAQVTEARNVCCTVRTVDSNYKYYRQEPWTSREKKPSMICQMQILDTLGPCMALLGLWHMFLCHASCHLASLLRTLLHQHTGTLGVNGVNSVNFQSLAPIRCCWSFMLLWIIDQRTLQHLQHYIPILALQCSLDRS